MKTETIEPPAASEIASDQRLVRRAARESWLLEYIKEHGGVDVLNAEFVDKFMEVTGAKYRVTMWGANKCPMLGRDLARLAACGILRRFRVGLGLNWQPGFPTWVWSYEIAAPNAGGPATEAEKRA